MYLLRAILSVTVCYTLDAIGVAEIRSWKIVNVFYDITSIAEVRVRPIKASKAI